MERALRLDAQKLEGLTGQIHDERILDGAGVSGKMDYRTDVAALVDEWEEFLSAPIYERGRVRCAFLGARQKHTARRGRAMMDDLLKGLARHISQKLWDADFADELTVEAILRDVGLGELLDAGQAMRFAGQVPINFMAELGDAQEKWDLWSERMSKSNA